MENQTMANARFTKRMGQAAYIMTNNFERDVMKQIISILLGVLFVFLISGVATAQESPAGVINGEVINGTEGSGIEAGEQASMLIYKDGVLVETETTETDDEGKFQFIGVSTEPGYEYMMHINYAGVNYYAGEWAVFGEGETSKSASVNVCEPTTNDETIKVVHAHVIIFLSEDGLEISESFLFSNYGDRTYVGHEGHSTQEGTGILIFTFPVEAEVSMDFFDDFILLDNSTFADPLPFPPGERQLDYSYRLSVSNPRNFAIPLQINYPMDTLRVMVQDSDVEIAGDQLVEIEKISTQTGEQFIQLIAENLSEGTVLNISISPSPGKFDWVSLILWVIAGLLILAIIVLLIKRGKRRAVVRITGDVNVGAQESEQRLLHAIAQLDDEFEQGAIDEDLYQQARAEKKAQLLELKRRQQ